MPDEPRVMIPGKPDHRIVIVRPDVVYYEHVETGVRTPIAISADMRRQLHHQMAEIPDFDRIARDIQIARDVLDPSIRELQLEAAIADALRQVWNARGAADAEAIDVETHRVAAEANRTGRTDLEIDLASALRKLDR